MGSQLKAKKVQLLKVFLFDLYLTTLFYVFLPYSFFLVCFFFSFMLSKRISYGLTPVPRIAMGN